MTPATSTGDFGQVSVGIASATMVVQFTFDSEVTPGGWMVYTLGAAGLDYQEAPAATTCSTTTTYAVGASCSVAVQFTPRYAGLRMGSVQLLDTNGNLIATAHLRGIGLAPQVVFPSVTRTSTLGSGFKSPGGVAVDGSGDVFVADSGNNAVEEIVAVNGAVSSASQVIAVGSGFSRPRSVAVDASGDVFVADSGNSAVKEIVAENGAVSSTSQVIAVGSGFSVPQGVAVDASGNVFVTDFVNNTVSEIVAVSGAVSSASQVVPVGSGFSGPWGVAVDASGDVFVTDSFGSTMTEIVAVNGTVSSTSQMIPVGSGFFVPTSVAVDASGDVFVADADNKAVKEIVAVDGAVSSASQVVTVGSGFNRPIGVAVDASGNVFVGDSGNKTVEEIALATPPSLSFAAVAGATTSTGAQTVTVANHGNTALGFASSTNGANPGISSGFALDSSSTCLQIIDDSAANTLAPGAGCTLAVEFTPSLAQLGPMQGSLVLTDNALNKAGATQTIALSGDSVLIRLSPSSPLPVATCATPYSQQFSAGETGGASASFTFRLSGGTLPAGLGLSASGLLSGTPWASGSFSFTIEATDSNGLNAAQSYSLSVNKATPRVTTWPTASAIIYGQSLTKSKLTGGAASVPGTFAWTTSGRMADAGTHSESAIFIPNDSAHYKSVGGEVMLMVRRAKLTIDVNDARRLYGEPNPKFTGTVKGLLKGDRVSAIYKTAATLISPVGIYPISAKIAGASAANYKAAVTDGQLTIAPAPLAPPTFSLRAGSYKSSQKVTIRDRTPGVSIYYSTDGLTPPKSARLYTGPIAVSTTETIIAIAKAHNHVHSPPVSARYIIEK